jgi:hypothetical protein
MASYHVQGPDSTKKKKPNINYKSFYYKYDIWMQNLPKSVKVENQRLWAILISALEKLNFSV